MDSKNFLLFNLNSINDYKQSNTLTKQYVNFKYFRLVGSHCCVKISCASSFTDAQTSVSTKSCFVTTSGIWYKTNSQNIETIEMSLNNDMIDDSTKLDAYHICLQFILDVDNEFEFEKNYWQTGETIMCQFNNLNLDILNIIPNLFDYTHVRFVCPYRNVVIETSFTENILYFNGKDIELRQYVLTNNETNWYKIKYNQIQDINLKIIEQGDFNGSKLEFLPLYMFFLRFPKNSIYTPVSELKFIIEKNYTLPISSLIEKIQQDYTKKECYFYYNEQAIEILSGVGLTFFDDEINWEYINENKLLIAFYNNPNISSTKYTSFNPYYTSQPILFLPFMNRQNNFRFIYNTDVVNSIRTITNESFNIFSIGPIILNLIRESANAKAFSDGDAIGLECIFKDPSKDPLIIKKSVSDGISIFNNVNINSLKSIRLLSPPQFINGLSIDLVNKIPNPPFNITFQVPNSTGTRWSFFYNIGNPLNQDKPYTLFIDNENTPLSLSDNTFLNVSSSILKIVNIYGLVNPLIGNNIIKKITSSSQIESDKNYLIKTNSLYSNTVQSSNYNQLNDLAPCDNAEFDGKNLIYLNLPQVDILFQSQIQIKTTSSFNKVINNDTIIFEESANNVPNIKLLVDEILNNNNNVSILEIDDKITFNNGIRIFPNEIDLTKYWNFKLCVKDCLLFYNLTFEQTPLQFNNNVQLFKSSDILIPDSFSNSKSFTSFCIFTTSSVPNVICSNIELTNYNFPSLNYCCNSTQNMPCVKNLKNPKLPSIFNIYVDKYKNENTKISLNSFALLFF